MQLSKTLPHRFIEFILQKQLVSPGEHLLLAVSGGVDSVVLCALCREAGLSFSIAHVNFQLRGEESTRDEVFVQHLASRYQVPYYNISFDTVHYAALHKYSIQEAARVLRYEWFEKLLQQEEVIPVPRLICTAHHLDDNIETMAMHFFRGTGIHGLRGMLPRQGFLIRPLLSFFKEELMEYAKANNLDWVEDRSNEEEKYTRNYFRKSLLPIAEQIYPEARTNLARNLERFAEVEMLYNQAIDSYRKKLARVESNEIHFAIGLLEKIPALQTVLFELIHPYGFNSHQAGEVIKLLHVETGRFVESVSHRIFRNRKWLVIAPKQALDASHILISENELAVSFAGGQLYFEKIEKAVVSKQLHVATVDKNLIRFPLLLRRWKKGDYFYPFGMKKKKKLARFFIDKKLSKTEKEKIWILEMDKKIIWVIGHRIDDRFRIAPSTQGTIRIEYKATGN